MKINKKLLNILIIYLILTILKKIFNPSLLQQFIIFLIIIIATVIYIKIDKII